MKFIVSIILTALFSFALCLYLPWWMIAPAAFIVAFLLRLKPLPAFFAGFLALFLLWGGLSYWISNANEHVLAHKISMLILKSDNPYMLIFATAITGALVGGLGAITGSIMRKPAS